MNRIALAVALLFAVGLAGCRNKTAPVPLASNNTSNKTENSATETLAAPLSASAADVGPVAAPDGNAIDSSTTDKGIDAAAKSLDTAAESSVAATTNGEPAPEASGIEAESDQGTDTAASHDSASTASNDVSGTPQRIMLLAPGGPLLVDLLLTIDGRPFEEALATVVRDAIAAADGDQDGRATWDELTQNARLRYGALGNLPSRNENERLQLIRMYDLDRNGFAEPYEVQRFLTRNAAASRSFHLRSSNYYRDANRWDSPVRRLLDEDDNGVLDSEEIAASAHKLKVRDADDDDVLLVDDLIEITPNDVAPLQRRRVDQTESAIHLNEVNEWGNLLYTLEEMYSLRQPLDASAFQREPQMFGELDANGDGTIQADELKRLLDVPPHLVLAMSFGKPADASSSDPAGLLRLVAHPRDVPVEITQSSAARLTCGWSDVTAVFFARDEAAQDYLAAAKAQIAQYDANNDGYLEADEVPEFFASMFAEFSALDADMDQKLYAEELAAFQASRDRTALSQLRARAGEDRDALYTALDEDHDGRLTARELLGAPQRLAALDRDGDGRVSIDEIPTAMLLGVIRANPQSDDQLFTPPTAADMLAVEEAPAWFTNMDVNRDGEISRREFLGPLPLFDELDANQDGFLTVNEAAGNEVRGN